MLVEMNERKSVGLIVMTGRRADMEQRKEKDRDEQHQGLCRDRRRREQG